jgi:hypothetical protein
MGLNSTMLNIGVTTTDPSQQPLVAMLSLMRPGDEIRRFSNTAAAWETMCGCAGLALVREGEVIASFVTIRN